MGERERWECKVCSYAVSGPVGSLGLLNKVDAHERDTDHRMEFVSESNPERW
jgi:hypothetical protein